MRISSFGKWECRPVWPDLSGPRYAQLEHYVSPGSGSKEGSRDADRWNFRSERPQALRCDAGKAAVARALARAADAAGRLDPRDRGRDRASLRTRQGGDPPGRVADDGALRQGDQRPEEGAQRGHPGAQLPD